eukprot:COSAG03_NODE_2004_length_3235_cov_2.481824_3_plen_175_part_00
MAYVAAWADYLRFIGKHPSLFPSLGQLLTPASLETSGIHSIASLRVAYERLCDQLERDDPEIGTIKGDVELRAILGEQVSGVGTLRLARVKPQRAITHAIYAAVERSWRADASAADCVRITDAGGPEAAWVGQCPTRPECSDERPVAGRRQHPPRSAPRVSRVRAAQLLLPRPL